MIKDKIREWLGIADIEANTNCRFNIQSSWLSSSDKKREDLAKLTDDAFKEQIKELDLIWEDIDRLSGEPKVVPSAKTKNKTKSRAKK